MNLYSNQHLIILRNGCDSNEVYTLETGMQELSDCYCTSIYTMECVAIIRCHVKLSFSYCSHSLVHISHFMLLTLGFF